MSADLHDEAAMRSAMRSATLDVTAAPHTVDAVRAGVRRRRRRQWTVAVAVLLVAAIGSSVTLALGRNESAPATVVTTPTAAPPKASRVDGVSLFPLMEGQGLSLRSMPPAVADAMTDPAVNRTNPLAVAAATVATYPGGSPEAVYVDIPGGGRLSIAMIVEAPTPRLALLQIAGGGTRVPTTVNGRPAVLVRGPEALSLAWLPPGGAIVVLRSTALTVGEAELRSTAAGTVATNFNTDPIPTASTDAPVDPAEEAIYSAYSDAFDITQPAFLNAVTDGKGLKASRSSLLRNHPDLVRTLVMTVDSVVFLNPTHAFVEYHVTFSEPVAKSPKVPRDGGVAQISYGGTADWSPTGWHVGRAGYCAALAGLGAPCGG